MVDASGLKHGDLTYRIIGWVQRIHGALGPGFPEAVYHKAFCQELVQQKIPSDSERTFRVHYNSVCCGEFRADLVVEGTVIVELKALSAINGEHLAQILSYLKASGIHVGLLINFGQKSLETKRVVL